MHRLDINNGRIQQITRHQRSVGIYQQRGGAIVYGVTTALQSQPRLRYPTDWVRDDRENSIFEETSERAWRLSQELKMYVMGKGQSAHDVDVRVNAITDGVNESVISPDARWGAITTAYSPVWMIDLHSAKKFTLGNAHQYGMSEIRWSPDGARVIIKTGPESIAYTFEHGEWVGRPTAKLPALSVAPVLRPQWNGLQVQVRQGANEPATLVATNGSREIELGEPDPALKGIWLARSEPVQWTELNRDVITGGLVLPRNFSAGFRLPLVIQAYHYYPQFFLPDGPHPGTSDAAQSLAAQGFAVLQVEAWTRGSDSVTGEVHSDEGPAFVEKIDAAVAALAERGIIDPTRVGLTGFSRGGYLTYFAITHPREVHLAAAIMDDSYTGSYSSYLRTPANQARDYGGQFWESRESWLKLETTFNLNRVNTPALFTKHQDVGGRDRDRYGDEAVSTIYAFDFNRRPIDYLFFPEGRHMLVRPRERLALMNTVVDWMSLWLQDKLPTDPALATRWTKLRDDWRRQEAWEASGNPIGSRPEFPTETSR